mmetsp:Transcript_61207/g.158848  ORF Transcript_61207/g.158848 Transcript_61207/m.158848 type:complete len:359 (+) Transcript_61207:223-1299(+)
MERQGCSRPPSSPVGSVGEVTYMEVEANEAVGGDLGTRSMFPGGRLILADLPTPLGLLQDFESSVTTSPEPACSVDQSKRSMLPSTSSVLATFAPAKPWAKATRKSVAQRSPKSFSVSAPLPSESKRSKQTCSFSSIVPNDRADMPQASSTNVSLPTPKASSFLKRRPHRSRGNSGTARLTTCLNVAGSNRASATQPSGAPFAPLANETFASGLSFRTSSRRRSISCTVKWVRRARDIICSSKSPAFATMRCFLSRTASHRCAALALSPASSTSICATSCFSTPSSCSGHFSRVLRMPMMSSPASKLSVSGGLPASFISWSRRRISMLANRCSPQHFSAASAKDAITAMPHGTWTPRL